MGWPPLLVIPFWYGFLPAAGSAVTPRGNDLGLLKGKALIIQAQADIEHIWKCWPDTWIVWSNMLPRRNWREGRDVTGLNRAVKKVNRELRLFLQYRQGWVIPHPDIVISRPELYRADGIHLSDVGSDIFLRVLQVGLLPWVGEEHLD